MSIASLDHFLVGTKDLEAAAADIVSATGVEPVRGGAHPKLGTANFLLSLGSGLYFELIGPIPGESPRELGVALSDFDTPTLFWFAARCGDLDRAIDALGVQGFRAHDVSDGLRRAEDGRDIRWQTQEIVNSGFNGRFPFLIDWLDTPHPSATVSSSLVMSGFRVTDPDANRLASAFDALGLCVNVESGDADMELELEGPGGSVAFRGSGNAAWFNNTSKLLG